MFSPCGGSVISFIDNGLLRGWATADVEEINGGIFFFYVFSARDGWLCLVVECDVGGDFDCFWLANWSDLCIILLSPEPLCSVLSRLCRAHQPPGPRREATTDVFSEHGVWKVDVLKTLPLFMLTWHLYIYIYVCVCVWKISNNLHTMYDGFNSREDINQHIKTLVFSSQY